MLKTISIGPFKISEQACAIEMLNKISDFNFFYTLHWLTDFLAPICYLNKILQAPSYKLGDLSNHIKSSTDFLKTNYINVEKPLLTNSNIENIDRSLDEVMKYHLHFTGHNLDDFMSKYIYKQSKSEISVQ